MIFFKESHTYMLQDINSNHLEIVNSHCMENLLKKGNSSIISQFHAIQGCETTPPDPPSELQQVLDT